MGLDIKKVLTLGAKIGTAIGTGSVSLGTIPVMATLAGELWPGKDPDEEAAKEELDDWERKMILGWARRYASLMDIPMQPEVKLKTMKDHIRSDFIFSYANMPDENWVNGTYEMIATAVAGRLAAGRTIE